jgi:4-hydroxy-3-polyprenylbenzoate decarboxylase
MAKLSRLGAIILPAMPAFYSKPQKIEDMVNFIVGKVLDVLSIENDLYSRWSNGSE